MGRRVCVQEDRCLRRPEEAARSPLDSEIRTVVVSQWVLGTKPSFPASAVCLQLSLSFNFYFNLYCWYWGLNLGLCVLLVLYPSCSLNPLTPKFLIFLCLSVFRVIFLYFKMHFIIVSGHYFPGLFSSLWNFPDSHLPCSPSSSVLTRPVLLGFS